jgi:hypothetical protein
MIDCRGTPSRRASLSSDTIVHTGKSTFTLATGLRHNQEPRLIYRACRDLDPIQILPQGLLPLEINTIPSLIGPALRLIVLEAHKV